MTAVLMLLMAADPTGPDESGVLLLDFTAGYCQPCQQMVPLLQRMEHDGFPIRRIDITEEHDISRRYQVERIPTLVLLVNGREVKRFVGLTAESELRREMNSAARALRPQNQPEETALVADNSNTIPSPDQDRSNGEKSGQRSLFGSFADRLRRVLGGGDSKTEPMVFRGQDPGAATNPPDALVSAFAATVRIRVHDSRREDTGSGTICNSQAGASHILTCAHLFTGFEKDAAIEVDVFNGEDAKRFPATIVGGDHNSDLAVIRIQNAKPLPSILLHSTPPSVKIDQPLLSFGCDKGAVPSPLRTSVSKILPYLGPANLTCSTPPEKGRSGGGLFDASGALVGVCSAADPERNEGLYMAHQAVMAIIQHCQVSHLVNGTITPTSSNPPDAGLIATNQESPQGTTERSPFDDLVNDVAPIQDGKVPTSMNNSNNPASESPQSRPEITVVIDPKTPGGQKRVIVIPHASAWLVELITGEGGSTSDVAVANH